MTKSELIEIITAKQKHLPAKDVELALKQILEIMSDALAQGERIEIRGFGSFSLHFRPPRQGRNPKTGEAVALSGKYVPHFKPGKDLRERVNDQSGRHPDKPSFDTGPRLRCFPSPLSASTSAQPSSRWQAAARASCPPPRRVRRKCCRWWTNP
jgi:integration host factor subunit beta